MSREFLPCPGCSSTRVGFHSAPGQQYRVKCYGCGFSTGYRDGTMKAAKYWDQVATVLSGAEPAPEPPPRPGDMLERLERLERHVDTLRLHFVQGR